MSILLNKDHVIALCKEQGIHTKAAFNRAIATVNHPGDETKIGTRVWEGNKVSKASAIKVAQILKVEHYSELVAGGENAWEKLLSDSSLRREWIELEIENVQGNTRLFTYNSPNNNFTAEKEVSVESSWCLKLCAPLDYYALVILRSEENHRVITPAANHFPTQFSPAPSNAKAGYMRIPQQGYLRFETSKGLGWRQIILISSKHEFKSLSQYDDQYLDKAMRIEIAKDLLNKSKHQNKRCEKYFHTSLYNFLLAE